jgi:hypothetical protein
MFQLTIQYTNIIHSRVQNIPKLRFWFETIWQPLCQVFGKSLGVTPFYFRGFRESNFALIRTVCTCAFRPLFRSKTGLKIAQGCQIFLGPCTKWSCMYQMVIKYPKCPQNIWYGHKIRFFSNLSPSKIYPNWDFWFENKPSGNLGWNGNPKTDV